MRDSHYTIKLDGDKYTIINHRDRLEFLRYGEAWPGADDLKYAGVVRALTERVEELEMAIGQVLQGSLDGHGQRRADGMAHTGNAWQERLRRVLNQK